MDHLILKIGQKHLKVILHIFKILKIYNILDSIKLKEEEKRRENKLEHLFNQNEQQDILAKLNNICKNFNKFL